MEEAHTHTPRSEATALWARSWREERGAELPGSSYSSEQPGVDLRLEPWRDELFSSHPLTKDQDAGLTPSFHIG